MIYNDIESQLQRAAISINISTKKVIGKSFLPKENELEEHFNYVFNDKFKDVKFVEIEQKKCLDFKSLKSNFLTEIQFLDFSCLSSFSVSVSFSIIFLYCIGAIFLRSSLETRSI